jgi:hypothetical protein
VGPWSREATETSFVGWHSLSRLLLLLLLLESLSVHHSLSTVQQDDELDAL